MFCAKCGTKNKENAKFCEKCGNKLEFSEEKQKGDKKPKPKNDKIEKLKGLSKKAKIGIISGIVIVLAAIIALAILLNNPVKKVENYLTSYYENYKEDYGNEELVKIGDILRANKKDEQKLESISKQIDKTINNWVKNFNTSYKDEEELEKTFKKTYGVLSEIYNYFNGLEYVLTYEDYYAYYEELYDLYNSKENYLKGKDASSDSSKYSYYSRVIEEDSYYKDASDFVNDYLKDELENLKTEANKMTNLGENATNEDMLNAYIKQLNYLEENDYVNGIDLSTSADYKSLVETAKDKIIEYTKTYAEELNTNFKANEIMDMIDNSMDAFDYNSDEYNELLELKESYEDKLPSKLTSEYVVSYESGTNYSSYNITIDEETYDSYVSFRFDGETKAITFRLDNEYKTLKTNIVRGPNWDADFKGEIVIYGDDKELYRSGEITKTNELKPNINLDVTDVDDLKIEFVTKSEPDDWASFYIYLVEPYLYK